MVQKVSATPRSARWRFMVNAIGAEETALAARLEAAEKRIAELEARLGEPARTSDNSSLPPSQGHKARREGPRQGSLGRKGGGRPLAKEPATSSSSPRPRHVPTAGPDWTTPTRCCWDADSWPVLALPAH